MKKTILFLLIIQFANFCFTQTNTYQIVSSKEYPNKTRTSYVELDSNIKLLNPELITQELLSNPLISNFSFYNKNNSNECMFTSDILLEVETIVQMIFDLNEKYINPNTESFNKSSINTNNREYFFLIDGLIDDTQRNKIVEILLEDEKIINAVVKGSKCKVLTKVEISPEYVQEILNDFNVKINESSIK